VIAYAREIRNACCTAYGITPKQFNTRRRFQTWVECRWMCWMILYRNGHAKLPALGREFGGWNHGTICHGIHRVEELIKLHKAVRRKFDKVKHLMKGDI
jgi:chromosomal replication initiation ATPase DnaA